VSTLAQATCSDCGWQSKLTTPARARHGLKAHSCELQHVRQARAQRVAERDQRDGPKRDCRHERVRHEHGTRPAYVRDRCRCRDCRKANNESQRRYQQRKAQQQWGTATPTFVDAEPVRAHVRSLMAAGVGWQRIARLSGVPSGGLSYLLYGDPKRGRPPTTKLWPSTAQRLLAVRADTELAGGAHVPADGTRRRLQALVAVGWSQSALARRLGMEPTNFFGLLGRTQVRADTARAARALYEELWNRTPRVETRHQRASITRARKLAAARGWLPPVAWDDDLIDLTEDPAARRMRPAGRRHDRRGADGGVDRTVLPRRPDTADRGSRAGVPPPGEDRSGNGAEPGPIDAIAVQRVVDGDPPEALRAAERREVVRILTEQGLSTAQIAGRLQMDPDSVTRVRRGLRRTAGAA
jgi:hypothetical protein